MRDPIAVLRELGLTAKEARAYLELVHEASLTASTLSARIGDAYPGIYRTLDALIAKGWVTASEGRPRLFTSKPPAEAAAAAYRRVLAGAESAARDFLALGGAGSALSPEIQIGKGLGAALDAIAAAVKSSPENLFVVTPGRIDPDLLRRLLAAFSKARGGVEWYLNAENRGDLSALQEVHGANVRALAVIPKATLSPTRMEHTFLFVGRSRMITLDAFYRDGILDETASHSIQVSDADVVRVQLEALVESTRVLAGRPVPRP